MQASNNGGIIQNDVIDVDSSIRQNNMAGLWTQSLSVKL